MLTAEVFWKATTALVSAAFAVGIFVGNRERPANRFLAFFLLLIAGNQTAETFRTLATDPAARLTWLRVASVFAFLDPFILYYFASVFPERNALNRPRWVALAAAPLVVLIPGVFVFELLPLSTPESSIVHAVWSTYTAALYLVVLGHFVRLYLQDEDSQAARWGAAAMSVAAIPVLGRFTAHVIDHGFALAGASKPLWVALIGLGLVPALGAATMVAWVRRRTPGKARWIAAWAAAGVAFAVLAKFPPVYKGLASITALPASIPAASLFRGTAASWRWLLFGSVVSAGIARQGVLDLSLRSRARAAHLLVGGWLIAVVAAVGFAGRDLLGATGRWFPITLGLFCVAITLTRGFRRIVSATARAFYGVPALDRLAARLEVYREGVEQALAEDRSLDEDPELQRLQTELGLDEGTARLVHRLAGESAGPLAPGELLASRYRVREPIGAGGAGRAFAAEDELLERTVVLKERLHGPAEDVEAARREARLAGSVHHPNVVTVHDILERPHGSILVLEHVPSGTLADRIEASELSLEEALDVLEALLAGLAAVHEQGIVHRDLKPANVLLLEDGTPKLADFGVAKGADQPTAGPEEAVLGTRGWMAPEQRNCEATSPRTDLYAVGRIGETIVPDETPCEVREVLERALVREPGERWPSAPAMRKALRLAREGRVLEDEPASTDSDHVSMS